MTGWARLAAISCGVTVGLFAAVAGLVILVGILAARADRLCTCGHTFGEHQTSSLLGAPCLVCQSCSVFTSVRRLPR